MKETCPRLLILSILLLASAVPAAAQCVKDKPPSVSKGNLPPGGAMRMHPGIARVLLGDLLKKRSLYSGRHGAIFESKDIRVTREYLSIEFDSSDGMTRKTNQAKAVFKQLDYVRCGASKSEGVSYVWPGHKDGAFFSAIPWGNLLLRWKDERDAQRFAEALNRMVYEAHAGKPGADDFASFAAAAKAWRENPGSRPKPPEGWERYRVLAEQSIREKEFVAALENYEMGLESFPTWPEGWYNAALLYAELGEYGYAADRMRRYLELMPDAPDAQAAREKIIIWEDKARNEEKP